MSSATEIHITALEADILTSARSCGRAGSHICDRHYQCHLQVCASALTSAIPPIKMTFLFLLAIWSNSDNRGDPRKHPHNTLTQEARLLLHFMFI